jgi:hypothetical protein
LLSLAVKIQTYSFIFAAEFRVGVAKCFGRVGQYNLYFEYWQKYTANLS